MNYVLFGGDGFLGSAFRRTITSKKVTVIGRSEDVTVEGAQYFSVNKHSLNDIYQSIGKPADTVIIDFAYSSVPKTSFDDPVKDFTENLSTVIRHLDFAVAINASKYIYISSGGTVYGNCEQSLIAESASNFPISPYGITKMACERYVNMYHVVHGLNTCVVRPSNIYGQGQKPFRGQGFISTALALAFENKAVTVFGDGSTIRDFLYVQDFCEAMVEITHNGKSGEIYNVGSGRGHSITEIVDQINRVINRDKKSLSVQHLSQRPFDVRSNVLDRTKIGAITDWYPKTDLITGISHTWDWIKRYMTNH